MKTTRTQNLLAAALIGVTAFTATIARAADPLPSWNDGRAKQSIIGFVEKVTKEGSPDFVPVPERIAVFDNDGSLVGLRYDQWKIVFAEQRAHGMDVWEEPFVQLRLPKLFNLRSDPFETADHEGMDYERWRMEHLFLLVPAQEYVGKCLSTFKEFPPSQTPGSFSLDNVLENLSKGAGAK